MTLEWAETDARCDRVDEELGRRADLTNPEDVRPALVIMHPATLRAWGGVVIACQAVKSLLVPEGKVYILTEGTLRNSLADWPSGDVLEIGGA